MVLVKLLLLIAGDAFPLRWANFLFSFSSCAFRKLTVFFKSYCIACSFSDVMEKSENLPLFSRVVVHYYLQQLLCSLRHDKEA
jgi:hypothetical protein